jgi:plasmid maintenance system antidote protein VapI
MKSAANYLDDLRRHLGLPSDYAAAKALGLTRAAVSRYRNELSAFDDSTAIKVASLLGIDPLEVIAASAYQRAADASTKKVWAAIWGKATGAIAQVSIVCAVGALAVAPSPARAGSDNAGSGGNGATLYVMSSYRRRQQRRGNEVCAYREAA